MALPPTAIEHATVCDALSSLLMGIAAGDAAAFRRLYDLHAPRLHAVALRITCQEPLAADAVHDAFLQVWHNACRFDPVRGSARCWLLSLVRYRALDIVRCRGHEISGDDLPESVDDSPDPLACLVERSDAAALHVCLGGLRADRRQLVLLAFMDGLSYAQVAERMQMPIGTVKGSIRRSLRTMRRNLAAQPPAGACRDPK